MVWKVESLADRIRFESILYGFNRIVVFGALFFDESGGDHNYDRFGVAACIGKVDNWIQLEVDWRRRLRRDGMEGKFHALGNGSVQKRLNLALAALMKRHRIAGVCYTLRRSDYNKAASPVARSRYGDVGGFTRTAALYHLSPQLREISDRDFGYYVEQGGIGFEVMMQRLAAVYRDPKLRREWRMATYGPIDRRQHVQVNTADLVAHEVITSRHTSEPLRVLGDNVEIIDLDHDLARDALREFDKLHRWLKQLKMENKKAGKPKKKS